MSDEANVRRTPILRASDPASTHESVLPMDGSKDGLDNLAEVGVVSSPLPLLLL